MQLQHTNRHQLIKFLVPQLLSLRRLPHYVHRVSLIIDSRVTLNYLWLNDLYIDRTNWFVHLAFNLIRHFLSTCSAVSLKKKKEKKHYFILNHTRLEHCN